MEIYVQRGPFASSEERGCKKSNPKHKKICISKQKKTFMARKNRAHRDIAKMCLLCSCEQDCLMRQGHPCETRLMIQQLRQRLFWKNYNRAGNNGRSTDNVRPEWRFVLTKSSIDGHVDRSPYHIFQ